MMEDAFAESLFEFDPIEHDSNTMDTNRKIVANSEPHQITASCEKLTEELSLQRGATEECLNDNVPPQSTPDNLPKPELDTETKTKILEQIEFYFSDANVTKDKELAKQIRRNEMGYVSIKWITSFRKIQALTTDWKSVSKVLILSKQLKVSADKKMVRRKHPIPKKSDQFADKTIMAQNLSLQDRSVECVKEYFRSFGKVTLVRFLTPGKPFPDDIANLRLRTWSGSPKCDIIAVEFESVEAAERATLSNNNNWRSTSNIQLLRPGPDRGKSRKSSEGGVHLAYSFNQSCAITDSNNNHHQFAQSLPKQLYHTSPSNSPTPYRKQQPSRSPQLNRFSFPRSANSYSDSCSPSANSYLGQRLALEKTGTSAPVAMLLIREPKGPDGTKGFSKHRK